MAARAMTPMSSPPGATLFERADEGTDLVETLYTHVLADNFENLTLQGGARANGTGNGAANILTGNMSANLLAGRAGDDLLTGSGGNDSLQGEAGNDTLVGGYGNDLMDGGEGRDTASYAGATTAVNLNLAVTTGQALGVLGSDRLAGIENLVGGNAADSLTGSTGDNQLEGGAGADTLLGSAGADTLMGGADADRLDGGAGNDLLTGDAGADTLIGGTGPIRLRAVWGRTSRFWGCLCRRLRAVERRHGSADRHHRQWHRRSDRDRNPQLCGRDLCRRRIPRGAADLGRGSVCRNQRIRTGHGICRARYAVGGGRT
ncbi:calcium-binding protein [Gemmobacter lanyuensis]